MWTEIDNNGHWERTPFGLDFPDLCMILVQPGTSWYPITKLFTNCPPKKGVS